MKIQISIDGTPYEIEVEETDEEAHLASLSASQARATIQSTILPTASAPSPSVESEGGLNESKLCRSPVAGIVMQVHVQAGDYLEAENLTVTLEAMKMETKVNAPFSGTVKSIHVGPGEAVKLNQILVEFF